MLKIENLTVTYPLPSRVQAVASVNLEVKEGEFVVIAGVSGSGKSTLLRAINRLAENDRAEIKGRIYFNGVNVLEASKRELRRIRAHIGFVFQEYNLVERSRINTNVLAGKLSAIGVLSSLFGRFPQEHRDHARQALKRVGIDEHRHGDRASSLSGGQKQRVGIARALVQQPQLILADEPVASLDPITANTVMSIFKKINEEEGITTVINLHDPVLTYKYAKRIVGLKSGRVIYDKPLEAINRETFEQEIYGSAEAP